jgi:predicted Rossmann fold flavoprotein
MRVLLIEKMPRTGTKILMSGGTRCNITHDTDRRGIIEAFGARAQGRFLHSALAAFSPQELIQLIEAEGVPTYVEEGRGKIFPVSDRASDVLSALMRRFQRSGAELSLREPVLSISRSDGGFEVVTGKGMRRAKQLVITTGGKSYPGSGTSGDAYRWLEGLGHLIIDPKPALTPITTDDVWVTDLRGIALERAMVRIKEGEKVLAERLESVLFTHFGLSGPAILDVSRVVARHASPARLSLEVDVFPDHKLDELDAAIRITCGEEGKKQLGASLFRELPRRLVESIMRQAGVSMEVRGAELGRAERGRVAGAAKGLQVRVRGVRGFQVAEVTSGGVSLNEVDSRTMESKLIPNLFFAGEVLDLDGPIGGYNFQAAFSTGWLAANSLTIA